MSKNISLFNKYRPNWMDEVIGQEQVVAAIRGKLANNDMPKASLFYGVHGTGKTTIARIGAKAVNCEHPTENGPCCECDSCKSAEFGQNPDIIELDAASHNKVADVSAIIDNLAFLPLGKKKVVIFDEVHMLTKEAFNKLLKIVEEPPEHVMFIFCTTERERVPATILSRCNQFEFRKVSDLDILNNLRQVCEKEGFAYEEDALAMIVAAAGGSVRDSLSILEQLSYDDLTAERVGSTLGLSSDEIIFGLLKAVSQSDMTAAISYLKTASDGGADMASFLKQMADVLMRIIDIHNGLDINKLVTTSTYAQFMSVLVEEIDVSMALHYIHGISDVLKNSQGFGLEFAAQLAVLNLVSMPAQSVSSDTHQRILKLENEVALLQSKLNSLPSGGFVVSGETSVSDKPKEVLSLEERVEADNNPGDSACSVNSVNKSAEEIARENGFMSASSLTELPFETESSIDSFGVPASVVADVSEEPERDDVAQDDAPSAEPVAEPAAEPKETVVIPGVRLHASSEGASEDTPDTAVSEAPETEPGIVYEEDIDDFSFNTGFFGSSCARLF